MVGYVGPAIRPAELISAPAHSLYVQSYRPREMTSGVVNADGWGAALWLDDSEPEPAIYRTPAPIWADPNLRWIGERLRSRALLAAVRSATPGIGYELSSVQPFGRGRIAFLHNGFVRPWRGAASRRLLAELSEAAWAAMQGASDSEAVFALVLDAVDRGAASLAEAVRVALRRLTATGKEAGAEVVATLIVGDGKELVGCRHAVGRPPATLYVARLGGGGWCISSEPLWPDGQGGPKFQEIRAGGLVVARPGEDLRLEGLE
jgi:gamma-glutamyl hercynylcysteine S-oxide hydrolase